MASFRLEEATLTLDEQEYGVTDININRCYDNSIYYDSIYYDHGVIISDGGYLESCKITASFKLDLDDEKIRTLIGAKKMSTLSHIVSGRVVTLNSEAIITDVDSTSITYICGRTKITEDDLKVAPKMSIFRKCWINTINYIRSW
ncbi:MAG: hypothetical protein KAX49_12955 [Halanaerobiales bacterium]|nr:hypothetical protein [Halanaerobiales bacterium]